MRRSHAHCFALPRAANVVPTANRPPGKKYLTVNAYAETAGEKPAYRSAWRAGQRCLIPAVWIYEPKWETGKHVRYWIGLAGWRPFCVVGLLCARKTLKGGEILAMAMLTVSADEHPMMRHVYRPGDEERSVVILRSVDDDARFDAKNVEVARTSWSLSQADEMAAEPALRSWKGCLTCQKAQINSREKIQRVK